MGARDNAAPTPAPHISKGHKKKKIGCHHDNRFSKTNYLKTNLLKQIKNMLFPFAVIFFQLCKVKQFFWISQIFPAKTSNMDDNYAKGCRTDVPHPFFVMCMWQKPLMLRLSNYIMPGWGAGIAGFSSGLSTMRHSVVRNMPAIEAAFSRATRATLAGSMTPTARRSW